MGVESALLQVVMADDAAAIAHVHWVVDDADRPANLDVVLLTLLPW